MPLSNCKLYTYIKPILQWRASLSRTSTGSGRAWFYRRGLRSPPAGGELGHDGAPYRCRLTETARDCQRLTETDGGGVWRPSARSTGVDGGPL